MNRKEAPADDPCLNTRELLYAASEIDTPLARNMIATVMNAVAALAYEVARHHGCTVSVWNNMDHNESCFVDGPAKALRKLACIEGAL